MKAWVRRLFDWAGRVGAGPGDSPETLLQKRLTVALCVGTLPLTVGWSLIYLAAGAPLAAAVPGFYSLFTPLNTAVFAWTRNLAFYRFTQLLLILLLVYVIAEYTAGKMKKEDRKPKQDSAQTRPGIPGS